MIELCCEFLSVQCIWLHVLIMLRRVNPHSIVIGFSDCNETRIHNYLVGKRTLNCSAKLAKRLSCVLSTYLYVAFDCIFLSCLARVLEKSRLYRCLNVKELLPWKLWYSNLFITFKVNCSWSFTALYSGCENRVFM